MYGQPPGAPGNWGPPPGAPPGGYGAPPPPPMRPPPAPRRNGLPGRMLVLLVGLPLIVVFAAIGITVSVVEHGRNYVVFDTAGVDHHVRVDGADLGSAKKARTFRVEAGKHTLAVVDATGQTVAQTTTDVPAGGWRGVFSTLPSSRYAIVTVVYNSSSKPQIRMLEKQGAGLHAMNDGNVSTMQMEQLGDPFPATGKRDESSTRLCRIDANGHAECLR